MTRPVRLKSLRFVPVLAALVLAGAGCGNRIVPLGPSGNPTTAVVTVESFIGVLPVGGFRFYSFTVPQDGLVSLTLLSLTENGEASSAKVNVGIGVPQGTGCSVIDSRTTGPDVRPQFKDFFQAAVYCVRVADVEGLAADVAFAVNIAYPKPLQ
jgi:hypothetical protein